MNDNSDGSPLDNLGRNTLVNLLKAGWKHQDHLWSATKAVTVYRAKPVRISMASLLRLEHDGKFLLIRNPNRPESFGPIGGVFKYYPTALNQLDAIEFKAQVSPGSSYEDFERDLRGEISSKNLPVFLNWFKSRRDREEQDCIRREIREELGEIGIGPELTAALDRMSFSLVRRVHEGPYKHAAVQNPQFRYFEVFRPVIDADSKLLIEELFSIAESSEHLLAARAGEIEKLRAENGAVIGGHSQYLNSSAWHGAEPPAILDR